MMLAFTIASLMLFGASLAEIHHRRRFAVKQPVLRLKFTFREVLTAILLMIPSAGTMLLTYYGIASSLGETGAGVVEKGQALAFSLTIGVFAWLGWFYLFGVLYHLRGSRLAASVTAGIFYISTLAAIDAPFNMLALAGPAATQISLVQAADSYDGRKEAVIQRATAARKLVPGIRTQQARFAQLAEDEVSHGTYSGSPKAGKVSGGFGQIATVLGNLADGLETGLAEADKVESAIKDAFVDLKAQAFRQGPIRARMEAASVDIDRIDGLLARLDQYDYAASIEVTLRSLEAIFPPPTVAKTKFERTQNEQLAIIAEMGKPVAAALRDGLKGLDVAETATAPKFRPMAPHDAIFFYWRELLPQWCAAAFIDLAPAALLIILIAAYRQDRRDGNEDTEPVTRPLA